MDQYSSEVIQEGVELSWAVFSTGRSNFEGVYDGVVGDYEDVVKLRRELPVEDVSDYFALDFPKYENEEWAEVFLRISPDMNDHEVAETMGLSSIEVSHMIDGLENSGLVKSTEDGIFYTQDALPYLMLFEGAERLLKKYEGIEPRGESGGELHDIMRDIADSEDDLVSTEEQRIDGGIDTRENWRKTMRVRNGVLMTTMQVMKGGKIT